MTSHRGSVYVLSTASPPYIRDIAMCLPRYRLSTFGRQIFAVRGWSAVWDFMSDYFRPSDYRTNWQFQEFTEDISLCTVLGIQHIRGRPTLRRCVLNINIFITYTLHWHLTSPIRSPNLNCTHHAPIAKVVQATPDLQGAI